MPAPLLDAVALIMCPHGGKAGPTLTSTRVRVGGTPLVTRSPSTPYQVSSCANPAPPGGSGPCLTANWLTAATRVRIEGMPALLADSSSLCSPTGALLSVLTTQQRVKGV